MWDEVGLLVDVVGEFPEAVVKPYIVVVGVFSKGVVEMYVVEDEWVCEECVCDDIDECL